MVGVFLYKMNPYLQTGGDSELTQLEKIGQSTGGRNPIQEQRYQQLKSQADANDPVKQAQAKIDAQNAANQAATDARFASNKQELSDFNSSFGSAVPSIINEESAKYNLPGLANQATALNNRVTDLQGNLTGQGAGGYASSNQVDAAINSKYLPRYQTAVTNLNNASQLAAGETQTRLTPYTTQANLLNERLSREATGYSQEQQQQLDSLVAQMQAGVQLSTAQIQQMTQLAVSEQNYQAQLATLQNQKEIAQLTNDRLKSIGAGGVYDPVTGQVIQGVKASSSGGSGSIYNPAGV